MKTKIFIATLLASMLYGMPANGQVTDKAQGVFYYSGQTLTAADSVFMEKYNVVYDDKHSDTSLKENFDTFRMLDKAYGKKWRKEVSSKPIGFKLYLKDKNAEILTSDIPEKNSFVGKDGCF